MPYVTGGARTALLLLAPVVVALCGCSAEPDRPGAVSAEEERQLNAAAEMLDANSLSAAAADEDGNHQ
jgi:hypothetical protein